MSSFIKKLRELPVPLGGVALGISGLGAAFGANGYPEIKVFGVCIATILVVLMLLKYIFHFDTLNEELKNPTIGAVLPTIDMAAMIIASVIVQYNATLGKTIWVLAIICHAILFIVFMIHRFRNWSFDAMVPTWNVPFVGAIVASVTSANMGMPAIAQGVFYVGFVLYIIIYFPMLYRVLFNNLEDARVSTFGIMGAPASLSLAGYLGAFKDNINLNFVYFLIPLALFMTVLVYLSFFRIFRLKFNPGFAALTFPLAIGSTATINVTKLFKPDTTLGIFLRNLAKVEITVATIVIIYVSLMTFKWIYVNIIKNKTQPVLKKA